MPPTVPNPLDRFHALAREFRDAAEQGDAVAQERILSERRRLLPELQESECNDCPSERETRARVLQAILALDREAEAILTRQRKAIGQELLTLDSGRRGLHGYSTTGTGSPKWIDERG